jgi:hypothetical protein
MKQNERCVPPGGARHTHVRVVVHIANVLDSPASHQPHRPQIAPAAHRLRFRRWGVARPEASYPFRVESDAPALEASSAGEAWRAMLALAAGLSLAVVSYAQFRGARGELPVAELTAALAPAAPLDTPDVDLAAVASDVVDETGTPSPQPVERRRNDDRGAPAPARRESVPRAETLLARASPPAALAASGIPEVAEAHAAVPVVAKGPAAIEVEERVPAREAPVLAAALADPALRDEDHIHAALTRWRTAYSALDASAAREVWPSVDARALARAFQALKSQELRFDRCNLTVNGGSARAACTGRAVYVPRIGKQSPRATSHEWTFELTKSDERWTIASARSNQRPKA